MYRHFYFWTVVEMLKCVKNEEKSIWNCIQATFIRILWKLSQIPQQWNIYFLKMFLSVYINNKMLMPMVEIFLYIVFAVLIVLVTLGKYA